MEAFAACADYSANVQKNEQKKRDRKFDNGAKKVLIYVMSIKPFNISVTYPKAKQESKPKLV